MHFIFWYYLQVLCTVCDQEGPNRAAINRLYRNTHMDYARRGEDNWNFGFEIDGKEIVPLYDVPNLLKCIRNILHQYSVSYTWRAGGEKTATWDHIRQVYELEDPAVEYRLCHKLTDAHIANSKKMKVSIAAQVMSARVAVAMKVYARSDGGFNFVSPRNFNQDPLENFFCSIRRHGMRNINPDCHSFKNSYKSLLIANYMSSKSPSSNCEDDGTHGLSSLESSFAGSVIEEETPSEVTVSDSPQILPPSHVYSLMLQDM
nr:unnamed protein product [Callosobruchus analis]